MVVPGTYLTQKVFTEVGVEFLPQVLSLVRLLFRHNPFKHPGQPQEWMYGRGTVDDGEPKYIMRGLLDSDKDDLKEVVKREEKAKPR